MTQELSDRRAVLERFVGDTLGIDATQIEPASADASFRSYWRVATPQGSRIVMDSPPDKEPVEPWLDIGARLRAAGLHAPEVYAVDAAQGFLIIEDFGTRMYLPALSDATADALYADALEALHAMQTRVPSDGLPRFDCERMIAEMEYLPEWFLQRHLGVLPGCHDWDEIELAFGAVANVAASQPYVFMHRDFHSRNLMLTERDSPGVIDFQGAMHGPLTYDLVSLLRDCYIAWPAERVDAWAEGYRQRLVAAGITDADARRFRRWFDFTGLQRHFKVLGLFCRLCYRDGKTQYLRDLPLVLDYALGIARQYDEFAGFVRLIERATAGHDLTRRRDA
ncbi:aminoglycoside phosphotransferase family protein [Tahibacter soli]|uniref:Phosphotransferase n=1 Tax=Tahibacter soli TaxID=2983605 RepID=A0A9X4BLX3_9GAMM|nr:phosphotransferase [Tahibacter soli]MDC8015777.1 phosphotransferase [Tahibacter soli]